MDVLNVVSLDILKGNVHKEDRMCLRLWRLGFHVYALVVKKKIIG